MVTLNISRMRLLYQLHRRVLALVVTHHGPQPNSSTSRVYPNECGFRNSVLVNSKITVKCIGTLFVADVVHWPETSPLCL